ncbi:MAG: hypothetical protein ACI3WQ_11855 [Faecousia sp.]
MNSRYRPTEIAAISSPVTARNSRNVKNRPVIELYKCTPSQIFDHIGLDHTGTICILGNPARGIEIAKAIIRRSRKPFLLIGPAADKQSAFSVLGPEWTMGSAQAVLPGGNGAILFEDPYSSHLELCEFFVRWSRDYFLILHLCGGVQASPEILDLLSSTEQCLVFCDSVPQGLRSNESRTPTTKEFLCRMSYLFVFSSAGAARDLTEVLPTYQYERVTDTMSVNSFSSHPIFHPFHLHKGQGISWGQTRTMEYKKSLFEVDELEYLFDRGVLLSYVARINKVFLANLI